MTMRPWRLPSGEIQALRLLEHMADSNSRPWVEDLDGHGVERQDVAALLRDCERAGQVELEPRRSMRMSQAYPGARLTRAGANYVEQIRERRSNPIDRARATRTELLLWLYGNDAHLPVTTSFLDEQPTYYGVPFTEQDTLAAAKHLLDLELVRGPTAMGSRGAPLRIELTTRGRTVVEQQDGDPAQVAQGRPANIYNQHIYNPTGSIAQGESATAITHQGLTADQIQDLQRVLVEGMSTLESLDRQDAEQIVEDLLSDLQADSVDLDRVSRRVSSLQRLGERLGNAALMAAASDVGKRVLALLAGAL